MKDALPPDNNKKALIIQGFFVVSLSWYATGYAIKYWLAFDSLGLSWMIRIYPKQDLGKAVEPVLVKHFLIQSLLPNLCRQRQFIKLGARLSPTGVVLIKDCDEVITVCGLNQMGHFMHDDVLQQILRFFHQFRIDADVSLCVIATTPLGFHPL